MTVGELKQFLASRNVSDETELCMELGIDCIDYVDTAVYNGVDLTFYAKTFGEDEDEALGIA